MTTEPLDDADALRARIADTRAELAETVEALAEKTDVPARAKEAVSDLATGAVRSGREAVDHVSGLAAELPGQLRSDVTRVRDMVTGDRREQTALRPVIRLAAVAALVIGVVVWLTRRGRT